MKRHRATMKHISARGAIEDQNKKVMLTQQLLPVVSKDFMTELVKTFLAADIPLHKLHNPHVIQLFENLSQKMPSETVCRDYVKTLANNKQDHLKYLLKDKCIFIVIDESEVDKTKFINIIVGGIDVPEKTYLIECCVTETMNQSIICMKIDSILCKLNIARELSSVAFGCGQLYDGLHSDTKGTLPTLVLHYMSCAHAAQLCVLSLMSTTSLPVLKRPP